MARSIRMSNKVMVTCLGMGLVIPFQRASAQDRAELIQQAEEFYTNFQFEPALNSLKTALDPTRGQPDSTWMHGVHLLAQIYFDLDDSTQAGPWLRWAMRTDPTIGIDASKFTPDVLAASGAARSWVRRTQGEGDFVTTTFFEWPLGQVDTRVGQVRIQPAGLGTELRVLLQRPGDAQGRPIPEGRTASVAPGSYEITAAADGFLTTRVTREILPGVSTVLRFDLVPISVAAAGPPPLPETVLDRIRNHAARLAVWRQGQPEACGSGFYAGSRFFVTTFDAIAGADSVAMTLANGSRVRSADVRVAAFDTTRNLAVLAMPAHGDSLAVTLRMPSRGQYVFPLRFPSCGDLESRGVRVALGADPIELAESVEGAQFGAAVVDSSGAVLGLTFRGDRAIPGSAILGVVDEARQRRAADQVMTVAEVSVLLGLVAPPTAQVVAERRGGSKAIYFIAAAGAVGAGAAAYFLLAPADTTTNGDPRVPTTITITIPPQ